MRLSTPILQKNSQRRPFPHRGKFFEKFFRGHFSGEFSCKFSVIFQCIRPTIHHRRQAQRPRHNAPVSPPGRYTHTRPHERPYQAASTGSRPGQRSARHQLHQAAATVPPIRAGKIRGFFPVAVDPAGQAGPEAIRTYAHTPAGQRNARPATQATHPHPIPQQPGNPAQATQHPPPPSQCQHSKARPPAKN